MCLVSPLSPADAASLEAPPPAPTKPSGQQEEEALQQQAAAGTLAESHEALIQGWSGLFGTRLGACAGWIRASSASRKDHGCIARQCI